MGLALGVFGAGGSILTVPILVFLFRLEAREATHLSLLVVGLVSAFGALGKRARLSGIASFAVPTLGAMVVMRAFLLPALPEQIGSFTLNQWILGTFAVVMIAASLSMLFVHAPAREGQLRPLPLVFSGLATGAITGFVGAGGGFLIVPILVFFAGLAFTEATQASLLVIAINSLTGFFSSPQVTIPWSILTAVLVPALFGMFLGRQLAARTDAARLKPAFGAFVLFMGVWILLQQRV
jgi:uncharacterized membrane protein YfcA